MSLPLDDDTRETIRKFCETADELFEAEADAAAVAQYTAAWNLLPDEKLDYPEAIDPLVGIGEVMFLNERYADALDSYRLACACPTGDENSHVWLRLGQCLFETGDAAGATEALAAALAAGGEEVFEDEDPKYLALVQEALGGE